MAGACLFRHWLVLTFKQLNHATEPGIDAIQHKRREQIENSEKEGEQHNDRDGCAGKQLGSWISRHFIKKHLAWFV